MLMQKWEYFVAPLLEHNPGEILNTFGDDGWELVSVAQIANPMGGAVARRLPEAPEGLGPEQAAPHQEQPTDEQPSDHEPADRHEPAPRRAIDVDGEGDPLVDRAGLAVERGRGDDPERARPRQARRR